MKWTEPTGQHFTNDLPHPRDWFLMTRCAYCGHTRREHPNDMGCDQAFGCACTLMVIELDWENAKTEALAMYRNMFGTA